jgi:hydroxyacylglutathione hydrolase
MILRKFIVGPIETNCYLVGCEKTLAACVIDPDLRTDKERGEVIDEIRGRSLTLKYIINTHFHSDHVGGNGFLKKETGAEILIHEKDAAWLPASWKSFEKMIKSRNAPACPACGCERMKITVAKGAKSAVVSCEDCGISLECLASPPADRLLEDGDVLHVGDLELSILHTPGHSRGGISLYLEGEGVLFSGDTLFRRSIGRTDLLESSFDEIMESLGKLMKLPDGTVVYPGHGDQTTIGEERRENPYLYSAG